MLTKDQEKGIVEILRPMVASGATLEQMAITLNKKGLQPYKGGVWNSGKVYWFVTRRARLTGYRAKPHTKRKAKGAVKPLARSLGKPDVHAFIGTLVIKRLALDHEITRLAKGLLDLH